MWLGYPPGRCPIQPCVLSFVLETFGATLAPGCVPKKQRLPFSSRHRGRMAKMSICGESEGGSGGPALTPNTHTSR